MARTDYRLCDVCDGKAFYDSNLNYQDAPSEYRQDDGPFRVAGNPQFSDADMNAKHGMRLDYVGDWAVVCNECSKNWKTQIVPIESEDDL
jgi:hypothetical protein